MYVDPQMRIPKYPKISEDFDQVLTGDDKLQIRGAEEVVLLSGSGFVRSLVELLDGSRSVQDIVDVIYNLWEQQAGPDIIRNAPDAVKEGARREFGKKISELLMELYMKGLLEDRGDEKDKFSAEELTYYQNQLLFFSRYVDVTRVSTNRHGLQLSLKEARVLIFSSGHFGRRVAERLCKSGVGNINVIGTDGVGDYAQIKNLNPHVSFTFTDKRVDDAEELRAVFADESFDLVILATRRPAPNLYQSVNSVCLEKKIPFTVGAVDGHEGSIGPTIYPSQTGCYTCYSLRQRAASDSHLEDQAYEEHLNSNRQHLDKLTELEHFSDVVAGMFAIEILKIITFFSVPLTSGNKVFTIDLLTWTMATSRFLKLPQCSSCSPRNYRPRDTV